MLKGYYDICQILVLAGSDVSVLLNFSRSDIMLSLSTELVVDHDCGHWLDSVCQPRSLKQVSRIAIRRYVGSLHKKDLCTLALPPALQSYILLPELAPFR